MSEQETPMVPVRFDLPVGYRAALKMIRINQGYESIGAMVKDWIDDAVKAGCADPAVATKTEEG